MIDKNKKYKTRSGYDVEIYATDFGPEYPVSGVIKCKREYRVNLWTLGGKFYNGGDDSSFDLIEYDPDAELLNEAARRYPVGTEFFSAVDGKKEKSTKYPCIYNGYDKIICVISDGGIVYCNGKWAEVVVKSDWNKLAESPESFDNHESIKIIIEKIKELDKSK
jgi:hypothetical protein